jgi:exosome complex exonuclease RRP6
LISFTFLLGGDYDYYSTFPKFSTDSKKLTEDTTKLIFEISRMIEPSKQNELSPDLMESSLYEHVVDMIDMLLERASLNLDDEAEIAPSVSSIRDSLSFDRKRIFQETNSTIEKPQSKFPGDVDNSRIRPFCPKLKLNSKPNRHPHAPRELTEHALDVSSEEQLSYLGPKTYFPHPYEMEIKEFSKNIPSLRSYFDEIPNLNPPMPPGLADYPMQYIETPEQLSEMIREIEHETAIAIDLEHHDYRTYQGLTCLMQVTSFSSHSSSFYDLTS